MQYDDPLPPTVLSVTEIARRVGAGEASAVEITRAHLDRIAALDPGLNALVLVDAEGAMAAAARLDSLPAGSRGTLAGVPFVVKDNIDVAGQVTACGSFAHDGRAATSDARVVRRLREQGAVLLGRANMDEVAMGASTQTSAYGPTRNPIDPRRSPGGSSGGCAAAVAAGLAAFSVGTDTGGSIREPASQCGVVGLAPSPDLVPMHGVVPFAEGLDRVGPLARTTCDVALPLEVMSGGVVNGRAPGGDRVPARVAVVEELVTDRNRPEVLAAFETWLDGLRARGVRIERVSIPDAPAALAAYMRLTSVAALAWLGPWVASELAGPELRRRYDYGRALLGDPVLAEAHQTRRRLVAQVRAGLDRCPVLVSPTMPTVAPLLEGETTAEELTDPMAAPYTDCWTVVANLTGVPALSIPTLTTGLPIGAMAMGHAGRDADLLEFGRIGCESSPTG